MEKNYRFKYGSSKKANESINRFNYYMEDMIPHYFPEAAHHYENQTRTLKSIIGQNNLMYFWGRQYAEGESLVNQQSILRSIKSTHLEKCHEDDEILKISQSSFQKISKVPGSSYGSGWSASEVLQFVLKPGQSEKGKKSIYQLYIIHHCQNITPQSNIKFLKWLHYVEKYSFLEEGTLYQTVAVANREASYFGYYNNQGVCENFLQKYFKFDKFQGYLLQYKESIKEKIKQSEDPAFAEQHKLAKHIPVQFLKMLDTLKKQFGAEKEQLICRFMIAREYKLEQVRKSIKEYLEFFEEYSKYKWQDFEEFHKMNIFYYLGQDYKGRPVILNKAKNVLVDKMDADKYCKYYMWYLEIYLPQKMRGYVTQLNIIADVDDIGQVNFKFAITKRNVDDGKKYCVERQYKFFAVNISAFAHFAYKFIKPLLPKKTQQKVYIGGNNLKEIFENLNKDMSENIIPTYLGGKNPLL